MSLPANVSSFVDRHGKERFRYRKAGQPTHYFKQHPGTAKHPSDEYKALIAGRLSKRQSRSAPGTIDDLLDRFYGSTAFNSGNETTRAKNRALLEEFRAKHGKKRVATMRFDHVEAILLAKSKIGADEKGRKVGGPFAAQRLRKQLRRMFALAVKLEMIDNNPVELAEAVKTPKSKGFHTWTDSEIAQYRRRHPLGTKARLALELILWTMQRGGDASSFSPKQRKGGQIEVWNEKNQKWTWVPEPAQLTSAIKAMPAIGAKTLLVTEYGKPFTRKGFSNWFKDRCVEADLPHCSAHGVRKATARRLVDHAAATQQELKAAGGWSGDREVAIYTAEADQKRLASAALTRLAEWDLANQGSRLANSPSQEADE